mmetsp:Transcript_64429/g.140267  ORF Transcript_64429/g.140267 Transcript_64429/m.140267 type:complete len:262 (+) Transcript_64429:94-879(+)
MLPGEVRSGHIRLDVSEAIGDPSHPCKTERAGEGEGQAEKASEVRPVVLSDAMAGPAERFQALLHDTARALGRDVDSALSQRILGAGARHLEALVEALPELQKPQPCESHESATCVLHHFTSGLLVSKGRPAEPSVELAIVRGFELRALVARGMLEAEAAILRAGFFGGDSRPALCLEAFIGMAAAAGAILWLMGSDPWQLRVAWFLFFLTVAAAMLDRVYWLVHRGYRNTFGNAVKAGFLLSLEMSTIGFLHGHFHGNLG